MAYTHTGFSLALPRRVGSRTPRGVSDCDGPARRVHACNGPERPYDGARYATLCGLTVTAESSWDGNEYNIHPAGAQAVTCRRCQESLND